MERIKLIWDFRGSDAEEMARHHARHLEEYTRKHALPDSSCGTDIHSDRFVSAWVMITEDHMISVRDALRPHRGERHQSAE